jgi:hypothetical protein
MTIRNERQSDNEKEVEGEGADGLPFSAIRQCEIEWCLAIPETFL